MQRPMTRSLSAAFAVLAAALLAQAAAAADAPTAADVAKTYANIAEAGYADSLAEARKLKTAIDTLIKAPTQENLAAARKAWIDARVPYMQTEAFRFGNKIVDDWEGRVNAWPLDEGLIDYVSQEYVDQAPANDLYVANVIANKSIKINGEPVDTSKISKELLSDKLQEAGDVESNVPFYKRYFLGGSSSIRGWGRFEVGPTSGFGLPIGGHTMMEGSSEVRLPLSGRLGAVAFADFGNVWSDPWDFNPGDLRYAVGPGLRYLTPIGPARVAKLANPRSPGVK